MKIFSLPTGLVLKHTLIKKLLISTNAVIFLLCFYGSGIGSEIKKETIKFSSETAQIKRTDGVLNLSGKVKISYGQYLIKSDFLSAKTSGVGSGEIKFIEAYENIYFSNNKDIVATGNELFLNVEKRFVSIKGDVELIQGKSIIRAEKINVDLETETVDFEGIKDSFIKN